MDICLKINACKPGMLPSAHLSDCCGLPDHCREFPAHNWHGDKALGWDQHINIRSEYMAGIYNKNMIIPLKLIKLVYLSPEIERVVDTKSLKQS